jgi:ectoine hydroxylase-related dioxygenase (phytanoyl-CoA dioxygenase family)
MAYQLHQQARRLAFNSSSGSDDSLHHQPHETVQVRRLNTSAPLSQLVATLEVFGYVVLTNFSSGTVLESARKDVQPWLTAQWHEKAQVDRSSITMPSLLQNSDVVGQQLLTHKTLQALVSHFLNLETAHFRNRKAVTTRTDPVLSNATAEALQPGAQAAPLSRADAVYHAKHAAVSSYHRGRDTGLSIAIPTMEVSASTGAPRLLPGSHLWGDAEPSFAESDVLTVDMEEGDALITLDSLYTGLGGFRNGEKGEDRVWLKGSWCTGAAMPQDMEAMQAFIEEQR